MGHGATVTDIAVDHIPLHLQLSTIFATDAESLFRRRSGTGQLLAPGLPLPAAEGFPDCHQFRGMWPFDGADFEGPAVGIAGEAEMGGEGIGWIHSGIWISCQFEDQRSFNVRNGGTVNCEHQFSVVNDAIFRAFPGERFRFTHDNVHTISATFHQSLSAEDGSIIGYWTLGE